MGASEWRCLVSITQLSLWYKNILKLPVSLGELRNLQRLNLRVNYLRELPESVASLINLK